MRILSALYGAVEPGCLREAVSFGYAETIERGRKSLKAYWKSEWAELFEEGTVVIKAVMSSKMLLDRSLQSVIYERKTEKETTLYVTSKKAWVASGLAMRTSNNRKSAPKASEDGCMLDGIIHAKANWCCR